MTNATCEQSRLTFSGRTAAGYRPKGGAMQIIRQFGDALARRRAQRIRRKRVAAMEKMMAALPLAVQRDVGWPAKYVDQHPEDAE